jgi:hypothetical protein
MSSSSTGWGLLRRRERLGLTLRGWLCLLLVAAALFAAAIRRAHPFLAVSEPTGGGPLVIEGWLPDSAFETAAAEFKRNPREKIYVTGIPVDKGSYLSKYESFAQLGAATLGRLGLSNDVVQAVPAPAVRQDRTYASAMALREWLREHGLQPTRMDVVTCGAHARRTRLLFESAMGPGVKVGIIAVEPRDYDPQRWWASSSGFRAVTDEMIAYLYARVVFRAKRP